MIKGIGVDIIELGRVRKSLSRTHRLVDRVLTVKETEYFNGLSSEKRKIEFLAGRFAAKEAYAKALGTGIGEISFIDIEILPNEFGAPEISVNSNVKDSIFVSISHSEAYAVAQVIIEKV